MQKNRAERNTVAEFAAKHSVKEAAVAYNLSNAAVYRCLKIYRKADDYPQLSVSMPGKTSHNSGSEITISISFLKEYTDSYGMLCPIYQLTAIDKLSKMHYLAFSIENNKTILEIFKEYLISCYQQAGKVLQTVHCVSHKSAAPGYTIPTAKLWRKKNTAGLLTGFLDQNPEIVDCNQLLPLSFADQILALPLNSEAVPVVYPIIIQFSLLREIAHFEQQNQIWHKLLNSDQHSDLLEKTLVKLESMAISGYKNGNSSYSIEIYQRILDFTDCRNLFPHLTSRILIHKARIHNQKKESEQALMDLEMALKLVPDNGEAYLIQGLIYQDLHRYADSQKSLLKARDLYKAAGDIRSLGCYYECKAIIYYYEKEYAKALRNFKTMKEYAVTAEDPVRKFEAECFIGNISYFNRNYNRALQHYLQNETDANLMGDNNFKAITCYNLAITYKQLQNSSLAAEYLKKSLLLAQQYDHWQLIIEIHLENGDQLLKTEDWSAALKQYNAAWKLHQKFKIEDRTTVDILNYQGFISRKLKNYGKAIVYFNRAIKTAEKSGETDQIPILLGQKADVSRLCGRLPEAIRLYKKLLKINEAGSNCIKINASANFYLANSYLHLTLTEKAKLFLINAKRQLISLCLQNPLPKYQQRLDQIRIWELNHRF